MGHLPSKLPLPLWLWLANPRVSHQPQNNKKQIPAQFLHHLHALFAASPLRRGGCGLSATIAARKRARRFCNAFQCLRFKLGNRPKGLRLSEGLLSWQGWQGLQGLVRSLNYSNHQTIIAICWRGWNSLFRRNTFQCYKFVLPRRGLVFFTNHRRV